MTDAQVGSAPRDVAADRPFIVELSDEAAIDPALTGGKAAALARAAGARLDTLPGLVLTTAFCDAVDDGAEIARHPAVREAFDRAGGDHSALVARSSSVVEDTAASSMAGQFDSIIGVSGFDEFVAAVTVVLDSRQRAGAADQPIAVLVQPRHPARSLQSQEAPAGTRLVRVTRQSDRREAQRREPHVAS